MKKIIICIIVLIVGIAGIIFYKLNFKNEVVIKNVEYFVSEPEWDTTNMGIIKMDNGKFARCIYYKDNNTIEVNYLYNIEQEDYNDDGSLKTDEDGYIVNRLTEVLDVPDERKTKKGFQEFVLNCSGALTYSVSPNVEIYNRDSQSIGASYIDYLTKYFDLSRSERKGCNGIEYLLLLLRNSFGQCADSFLGTEIIMNSFSEIPIKNVQLGDIGMAYVIDENVPGICVGFDYDKNPIFSTITFAPQNYETPCMTKEIYEDLSNIKKEKGYKYYSGNMLLIDSLKESKREQTNCGLKDRFFYKFYSSHSAIPWLDPETDGTANNKDLIVDDVELFIKQGQYRKMLEEGTWTGDDLGARWQKEHERVQNILKKEREDRINKIFSIPDVKIVEIYPEESE